MIDPKEENPMETIKLIGKVIALILFLIFSPLIGAVAFTYGTIRFYYQFVKIYLREKRS